MKIKQLLFAAAFMSASGLFAQSLPDHSMYVNFGGGTSSGNNENPGDWTELLDTWEPGQPFSTQTGYIDDNFFISRVRLKNRFENLETQADKSLKGENDKNLAWLSPVGESTKKWGPLQRYTFNGDNFNMWQYMNIHGNWSNSWFRVPGSFNDVAHKNGVKTGCLYFIDWSSSVTPSTPAGAPLAKLVTKNSDGSFKYAKKFMQMLKYYGIDGVGLNPEGHWETNLNNNLQDFFGECHRLGEGEMNWPFHVDWYAFVSNGGSLSDNGCTLSIGANDRWFHKNGQKVTDVFFLNYNWGKSALTTSVAAARTFNRPKDVYAGFDQQGRGYGTGSGTGRWTDLAACPAGIAVWGNHATNQLYDSSNDNGSSDLNVQNSYVKRLELLFTGGTRNVLNTPAIRDVQYSAGSTESLKSFHGYSKVISAKSSLTTLPFVSRFNLGNGMFFKKGGVTTFNHKWYNIGMQDYLPTWRWWIENGNKQVPTDPIQCDFTFDDAWFGGSCLKIHGATVKSDIHLFKTKFVVKASDEFSITYKVNSGTDPKMKLMVSKEGAESTFSSLALPITEGTGQWKTQTFKVGKLGGAGTIACIGLSVENTDANYEVLLGELSLMSSTDKTLVPVTPVIRENGAIALRRTYNGVDAKIVFDCPFTGTRPDTDCPIYNDEVGAWYFEIYVKQAGKPETLVTTTTSWAAYVVDAPLSNPNDLSYQIGVRAVSPNGKTGSEIVWSKTLSNDVITPIETLTINKSIIKPNEEFVFGFEDPTHVVADFEILNSRTGAKVFSKNGVQKITLSLPDVDCYDVKVTYGGKTTITRGLIQITPIETGALPKINTMVADKTQVNTGEATNLTYTADKGEGTVSQSLYIADPLAIKVDKSVHTGYPFTYALWFKADKFSHATKGTVLLQKLNKNDTHSWTESAWGEVLVAIRSEMMSESKPQQANEVSLSTFGGIAGSSYPHGSIVDHAITSGYSVTPESWTHLAVTMDQNKKQCIYINGRKVCETTSSWKSILADTYLYIGGSTNDLAGFTGWIDELQVWNKALSEAEVADCMTGYAQAPSGLTSYFKFEDESGSEFINEGTAAASVGTATVIKWKEENKVMVDELQTPKRDLGVPSIEGIRNITFESAKWTLPGVTSQSGTDAVSATYQADGKYNVTLKLTNSWGTTEKTLTEYIVVGTGISGIENGSVVEDLTIYPNPFVESANIMFAAEGKYVVDVYNDAALKIASKSYHATAGEVCNLSFESEQGLYFVRVMRDGKCIKTFKITKDL